MKRLIGKQQANREKGESRTLAIIAERFWVWRRSVDVEGADFLVQEPADDLDELYERKRRIEAFGVVQAKYFEGKNLVRVAREYIEDARERARTDFFLFLHSTNVNGDELCYFFTAQQAKTQFYGISAQPHLIRSQFRSSETRESR